MEPRQWLVGDVAWQVEWCPRIPLTEDGDVDIDAVSENRLCATRDEALVLAGEVLPVDAFGCVLITQVEKFPYDVAHARVYPHVGYWEAIGETEVFDGGE